MRRIILMVLLCIGVAYAQAQEVYNSSGKPGFHKKTNKHKGYDPSRLILGGGINALFGDGVVSLGVSPIVGYRITDHFSAGVGLGYQYYKEPDAYFSYGSDIYYDKENIIYPNVWARYFVWRGLYVTTQFEYDIISLNAPYVDVNNNIVNVNSNVNVPCWLIGPGFKQPIGGRASLFIEIVGDLINKRYSPYYNTVVPRVGIAVGL